MESLPNAKYFLYGMLSNTKYSSHGKGMESYLTNVSCVSASARQKSASGAKGA